MGAAVGGDHHTDGIQILNPFHTQRAEGNAVGATVFYLIPGRRIMKTVDKDIVIKMTAFYDIFMGNVIITDYLTATADNQGRACSGDKSLFKTGYIFFKQFGTPGHTVANLNFCPGNIIPVENASGNMIVTLNIHQVVIMDGGGDHG